MTFNKLIGWTGKNLKHHTEKLPLLSSHRAALALTDEILITNTKPFNPLLKITKELPGFQQLWDLYTVPRPIEIACITTFLPPTLRAKNHADIAPLLDFCVTPIAAREYLFQREYGTKRPTEVLALVSKGLQQMFKDNNYKHWMYDTCDRSGTTVVSPKFNRNSEYVRNQLSTGFSLNPSPMRANNLSLFWPNMEDKQAQLLNAATEFMKLKTLSLSKYMPLVIYTMFPHRRLYRACHPPRTGMFTTDKVNQIREQMRTLEALGLTYSIANRVGVKLTTNLRHVRLPAPSTYMGEGNVQGHQIPAPYFYYKRF